MVAVGLVLLVLAVLVALGVVLPNTEEVQAEAFGVSLEGVSVGGLFLMGVVTGVVGALALGLVLGGLKRRRAKAVAHKRQVHSARSDAETLAEENARLQGALQQEQAAKQQDAYPVASGDATPPGSGRHGSA